MKDLVPSPRLQEDGRAEEVKVRSRGFLPDRTLRTVRSSFFFSFLSSHEVNVVHHLTPAIIYYSITDPGATGPKL